MSDILTISQDIYVHKNLLTKFWTNLSLNQKFASAGGLVILCGMTVSGVWVGHMIEDGVTKNAATSTALYADSSITPYTKDILSSGKLTEKQIKGLDDVLLKSPIGERLIAAKVWTKEGIIAYSSDHSVIGTKFDVTSELQAAFDGDVIANFDDLHDDEDQAERETGLPLLEIYSPIRVPWSGQVVAVAEFYENGIQLQKSIDTARQKSWFVVATIMLAMASLLMVIVHGGSKTINEQRKSLRTRLLEVSKVAEQNQQLHKRIQTSSERVTELNEQYLKRVSADLHDGPAQILALAALKMDGIQKNEIQYQSIADIKAVKSILDNAIQDIRYISRGLTLPEIKELSLLETIERAVKKHVKLTNAPVKLSSSQAIFEASHPIKICVFRFIQEALNNAWQHAGGAEQTVFWNCDIKTSSLTIRVSDRGPGFPKQFIPTASSGLGIEGMRERIRSIGGNLIIKNRSKGGAIMEMNVRFAEV